MSDARFPEVIPMASSTTRRHSRDDPREDVGEEVRVGVGVLVHVGAVECQLYRANVASRGKKNRRRQTAVRRASCVRRIYMVAAIIYSV